MQNNGPSTQEAPLGEPSSVFRWTTTGEVDDATPLPPDERFIGAVAVRFTWSKVGNKSALSVENVFIPPENELTLPAKRALIAVHGRLANPSQAISETSPLFDFALDARWLACESLTQKKRRVLGGLAVYDDGTAGLVYARQLPQEINKVARETEQVADYSRERCPRQEAIVHELHLTPAGASPRNISEVLRLILGRGLSTTEAFSQLLGYRDQAPATVEPVIPNVQPIAATA